MKHILIWLARSRAGQLLTNLVFSYLSFLIPAERLHETNTLVAFHHPTPAYPLHILLIPKRSLANFLALTAADADFLTDVVASVKILAGKFDLEQRGYRLICNGGPYQEVPHLHFHLISETA